MEKVNMFSIGDMVEYLNDDSARAGSIGVVSGPSAYEGFPLITFISGPDAGKSYAVNSGALKRLTGEEEQNPAIKEEIAVVEEKTAAKPVKATPAKKAAQKPVPAAPVQKPASTSKKKWSKVEVVAMIKEKDKAVERGIICLNKHHALIPEKSRSYVSYWAEYLTSGKHLTGRHLFNARRTCYFNAKVLVDAANGVI
jgi:hypothetical protein